MMSGETSEPLGTKGKMDSNEIQGFRALGASCIPLGLLEKWIQDNSRDCGIGHQSPTAGRTRGH